MHIVRPTTPMGALLALATSLMLIFTPPPALANTIALEEVIVTAERRTENLQSIPMSVSVFDGGQVSEAGISGLEDIAIQTPNFKFTNFNIGEPQLYLRGIGNTTDSIGADPAVAVFVDEVYVGRPGATAFDLYDLERIEVLRGPQGTLYGRNVAGGAINIYTRKPSAEFEAKAGASIGKYDLLTLRGYVNGALGEDVYGKLSFSRRQRDGFAESSGSGQELDDLKNTSVRGQALWTISANAELLLGMDYSKDDTNGKCRYVTSLDKKQAANTNTRGGVSRVSKTKAILEAAGVNRRTCAFGTRQDANKSIYGASARIDIDLGWADLVSLTAYRKSDLDWEQNLGPLSANSPSILALPGAMRSSQTLRLSVFDSAIEEAEQVSQELRLSGAADRLQWVAGLYYFREKAERSENFIVDLNAAFDGAINDRQLPVSYASHPLSGNVTFIQDNTSESIAAFGQFTYEVFDNVAVTLGARFTRDKKSITQAGINNLPDDKVPGIPMGTVGNLTDPDSPDNGAPYMNAGGSKSWTNFSPRLSLDWQATDDVLLYFTAARGYKSGAFASSAHNAAAATTTVKPEKVTNLEVGAKTQWFNDRLRLNLSAFNTDYKDLQVFELTPLLRLVSSNADKSEIKGIELDFVAAVAESLTINGSYAIMDAEYTDFDIPGLGSRTGNDLSRAPPNTWTVGAQYTLPVLGNRANLDFDLQLSHSGSFFFEVSNDPRSLQASYELLDASVKLTSTDGQWDLTFWGKNITGTNYDVHRINSTNGGSVAIPGAPATYGVSVNYYWQ